jgi:3-dehydroquinate dehydratase-1
VVKWKIQDENIYRQLSVCDVLEFRADTFPEEKIHNLLKDLRASVIEKFAGEDKKKQLLFTIRLPEDGGKWTKSPDLRLPHFEYILEQNLADWIDFEVEEAGNMPSQLFNQMKSQSVKLMLSHHNFQNSYSHSHFMHFVQKMDEFKPDIVKFAVTVQSRQEMHNLFEFSKILYRDHPLSCVISMGKYGKISRIGSPLVGAPLTYGYIGRHPTVPGQLDVSKLNSMLCKLIKSEIQGITTEKLILQLERVPHD